MEGSFQVITINYDVLPIQSMFSVEARKVQYIADLLKQSQIGESIEKSLEDLLSEFGISRMEALELIARLN